MIVKEIEPRPLKAVLAPLDYEQRSLDAAEEAISDIAECDEATLLVKWDTVIPPHVSPVLYILFRAGLLPLNDERCKRVHLGSDGLMHPAHAVLLTTMPHNRPLEGQRLKDVIRQGVEMFLRTVDIRVTSLSATVPLLSQKR